MVFDIDVVLTMPAAVEIVVVVLGGGGGGFKCCF